jgi:protein O-mannosyl-transferase
MKYALVPFTTLLGIALVIITLIVYWQVGSHEFVNFDDDILITDNVHVITGINTNNIIWAFTPVQDLGWFPVSWLSHMADVELYGMNPRGHHLTNVFFHIASSLLLFIFLFRTTSAPLKSFFVAFLFALHPLHVESVAWMAERRDVLSAFFGFLALLLYAEYVEKRRTRLYLFSFFMFVLALMSKPMLVTLPVLMLLIDFWPLNRYRLCGEMTGQRQRLVNAKKLIALLKEKAPFFAASFVCVVITLNVPSTVEVGIETPSLGLRIANAATGYIKYIIKMLWPTDLAVYYPLPSSIPLWEVVGALFIIITVTAAVILLGKRQPYLAVGWFWFFITLVPVLGIIRFGRHSIADRYTYISLIGLFIIIVWGFQEITKSLRYKMEILAVLATIICILLTSLTYKQIKYWENSTSLFKHAIDITSDNDIMHNNLGITYSRNGYLDNAIIEYKKAIDINKNYFIAYNNIGVVFAKKGLYDESIVEFKKAIAIYKNYKEAINNLGHAYACKGLLDEAIVEYKKAIELDKNYANAHYNLASALNKKGLLGESTEEYNKIYNVDLNP